MRQAKKIGYDLSQTFLKLEQLSLIAKQSSLFNDKSMEIQDLTLSIKQDMGNLNRQIAQLQQVDLEFYFKLYTFFYLFEVYERYTWIKIKKFSNTFQFRGFCFTSKDIFNGNNRI